MRTVVLAAFLTLSILSLAARAQQPPPGTPTKSLVPVAASTLAAYPDPYYGEYVSLTGVVDQTLSKLAFSVDQDKAKSADKVVLVLAPRLNDPVNLNTYVTVIGEVVRFDPAEIPNKSKNHPLDLSPDVAEKYRGQPAILATAVVNAAGVDVAMRLPPPMTAEEEAYSKLMRQIGPANAGIRKAIEGTDTNLAKEHAAVLKQVFTQIEAFWKAKGKADAMGWAQEARKAVDAIDQAAVAGKWDEVKTSATAMGQTCNRCHTVYRERFDEGSFRIKLGG
jgi:cytochrome c556